jgi:hypothetical protein
LAASFISSSTGAAPQKAWSPTAIGGERTWRGHPETVAIDPSGRGAGSISRLASAIEYYSAIRGRESNMVCDLLQKIELLHAAGTQFNPPHAPEIVKTLYEILTVLDGKGLALLAFDGIIVAATTFAAEKGDVFRKRGLARWLAILIIFLSLAAAALCLFVSEISYSFFHYVECSTSDTLDYSNEINHLAALVNWRTVYFQIAWLFSIVAIPLFMVMFSVSLNWKKQRSS